MPGYSVQFTVVDNATKQIEAINKRIQQMRAPMERQSRAMQQFINVSGLKKVADGFTAIARSALDAFSSLIRIVPVLGALTGAASIAGIAKLVSTWGQFGLVLQRDADRIGTSAQSLQRLQDVVKLAGGSSDDMTESLKGLTDAAAAAFTGDAQKYAWFRRAGIALTDINGQLRSTTELLPEVLRYLDSLKNPADRMKVALELGGQAMFNLTEDMERAKRPGESLTDTWRRLNTEASKFAPLTDAQIAAQQRYAAAVGALKVSFEHLQEQIGTTLAEAFTPLLAQFGEFVRTHTPQIIEAVNRLIMAFRDWVKGIDWPQVEAGAKRVLDALGWLVNNLDKVKVAAEAVAVLFAARWAIGIVTSIGTVITALGSVGAISAGAAVTGVGLLGTLGAVAGVLLLIEETWRHWPDLINAAKQSWETLKSLPGVAEKNVADWWAGRSTNPPPAAPTGAPGPPRPQPGMINPFTGQPIQAVPGTPAGPIPTYSNIAEQRAPLMDEVNRDPEAKRLLMQMMATEGGGAATVEALVNRTAEIRQKVPGYSIKDELKSGFYGPINRGVAQSTEISAKSAARYQGILDQVAAGSNIIQGRVNQGLPTDPGAGLPGRVTAPGSTDIYNYWEGSRRGVSFSVADAARFATAQATLATQSQAQGLPTVTANQNQLRMVGGYGVGGALQQAPEINLNMPQAEGKPVEVTGGAPVSGSVDVTVTHRNPPPGVVVAAKGTGDVNVAPPRIEQQQLAAA